MSLQFKPQVECQYFEKHSTHFLLSVLNIMLKESVLVAVLFIGVAAQTPISIDRDEIAQAHNFVRRGVSPSAANMEVMVSYH